MSDLTLEQMLSDEALPEVEESIEETEQPEQATGEGETTPAAEETPAAEDVEAKEGSTPEPETPSEPQEEPWTKKAVIDERRKRQELQAELEALKAQQNQQPADKPDWFDDPEKASQALTQQTQQMVFQTKVELSQEMMRTVHEDYDAMETRFFDMAQENPELARQLQQASNPARFAYETAKKAEKFDQLQNVDEFKARLEAETKAEIEAKVRAELEAKYQKQAAKEGAIQPSLAGTNSRGGISSGDYSGPTPLDEILK